MLNLSKVKMGPLTSPAEKRKYLFTINLEKEKIQRRMLRTIYENAYETYQKGDYEGAQELASRILTIDPTFDDATLLLQASKVLKGTPKPLLSARRFSQDKFQEGLELYQKGRLVEAARKWEEVVKLSPSNLKARYWYQRVNRELAKDHFDRGKRAYNNGKLREALDQWYSTLLLNPNYSGLTASISKAEAQLREEEANARLTEALNLYGQGKLKESMETLQRVLELQPGDAKAKQLLSEVRFEVANQYVTKGKKLFAQRRYAQAIEEWRNAQKFGYDSTSIAQLVSRATEQIRRKERRQKQEEEEAHKEQEPVAPQPEAPGTMPMPGGAPGGLLGANVVTEENRRAAQQHYLNGVVHFQNGDFQKARDEWILAKQLDPSHSDADAGLRRIDQMVSGGP
ncbi:MAG: hypothetical protein HY399_07595 [Elusimicrobia bacterium]|nr:hypothetical protein [Elusimicrobiota bacterium]